MSTKLVRTLLVDADNQLLEIRACSTFTFYGSDVRVQVIRRLKHCLEELSAADRDLREVVVIAVLPLLHSLHRLGLASQASAVLVRATMRASRSKMIGSRSSGQGTTAPC